MRRRGPDERGARARLAISALIIAITILAVAVLLLAGCGSQQAKSNTSDLTAGHRAELVTVGGSWLNPNADAQVTFRVSAGTLKVIADVLGGAARDEPVPSLQCVLVELKPAGQSKVKGTVVPLRATDHPALHHTIFTMETVSPLQPGKYRLTYRGHGRLKFLGISAQY